MSIFGQLRTLFAQKQQTAVESATDAAKAIAAGQNLPPDTVADIIEAAGIDVDQFEAMVAAESHRIELRQKAATKKTRAAEVEKYQSQIARIDQELTIATAKAREAIAPLQTSLRVAEEELRQATAAANELISNPEPDSALAIALKETAAAVQVAVARRDQIRKQHDEVSAAISRKANARATRVYAPIGDQDRDRRDPAEEQHADQLWRDLNEAERAVTEAVKTRDSLTETAGL